MQRWPLLTSEVAQRDQNYFEVTGEATGGHGPPIAKSFQYQSDSSSFVPSNVFNELQHEVSSLLEFKNALLETFPHLQGKLGHSHSQPRLHQSYNTSPPSSTARTSSSTLREHDSPLRSPNVSSAERLSAPGAVGGGRQIQHVHDSDEIPGSWNGSTGVGTLPRSGNHRGQKIRKSPEGSSAGSNIVDSGFSTETTKDISSSGTSTLLASNSSGGRAMNSHPNYAMDVRWDTWEQGPSHSHQPAEDELQFLLDVIHRKSVRLRRDLDGKTLELSLAQNQAHDPSHYQDATRSMAGTPRRLQPQIPLTPAGPQKGLRVISEHDASDNTLHGPLGGGHQPVINTSGNEVELLRRERELLMRRIAHLESENADFSVRMGGGVIDHKGGGEIFHLARTKGARGSISQNPNLSDSKGSEAPEGNAQDGGIVHSVQIRTGGVGELRRAQSVSGDANGNGAAPIGPDQHGVNIEIKQQRHARYSHPSPRAPLPGSGGISVVNLRGSVDNLLPHTLNSSGNPSSRSYSFNELSAAGRHRTNSFGTQQKLGHRPKVIPSRIVVPPSGNSAQAKISPQLNRVLSNKNLNPKSKSVENLVDGAPILGLKNANSEMNVYRGHPGVGHSKFPHPATTATQSQRLRGTTSELNMSRLGANEKLRFDTMEGILSMPVELTRGLKSQVKPNREKIRQVINMNNVIDLQRQLLTTVMENEVYKTQLERLSENWTEKIGDIERANGSLHHEVEHLRVENEELKIKVNKKLIELESAKAKLKVLEKNQFDGGVKGGGTSRNLPVAGNFSKTDLVSKNENRVHFDLHSTPKSPGAPTATKVVQADPSAVPARTAGTQGPSGDGGLRSGNTTGRRGMIHHSQLPSDTRQRLEEMANSASGSAKKYSNARSGDPVQDLIASRFNFPAGNNLVTTSQPLGIPTTATLSKPTVAPSSRRGDPSATPLSNNNRERSLNDKNIETTKVNTVPSHGHSSAGGGVSQTINNLNNNGTTPLPTSTMNHFSSISNDPSKKDPASPALISSPAQVVLTERDLKTMGRDTIAGLIAGILQKYSHKKEDSMPPPLPPREAFVPSPSTELVPTKMSPEIAHLAGSRTSMLSTPTGGNSSMKKISWEANNGLEEVTHMALQRHAATPQLGNLPETPSPESHPEQDSLHQPNDNLVDSLQYPERDVVQPDSLSFDEDTFNRRDRSLEFYDSISSTEKKQASNNGKHKKLIIPYTDSYSSNTSLFTSQEESIDSGEGRKDDEDEEESTSFPKDMNELAKKMNKPDICSSNRNVTLDLYQQACQGSMKRAVSASPLQPTDNASPYRPGQRILPTPNIYLRNHHMSNPDLRRQSPMISDHRNANTPSPNHHRAVNSQMNHNIMALKFPTYHLEGSARPPSHATSGEHPVEDPTNGQSMVRLATERMKRKFLGWS